MRGFEEILKELRDREAAAGLLYKDIRGLVGELVTSHQSREIDLLITSKNECDDKPMILPVWYRIAQQEMYSSVVEIAGEKDHPRIVEYHSTTSLKATDDETPWCASFVCWCLEQADIRSTRSARARSYESWGDEIKGDPPIGAVVVISRGRNPRQGHVGFFSGFTNDGAIKILGGNQGNTVSIDPFAFDRLVGYYWPETPTA